MKNTNQQPDVSVVKLKLTRLDVALEVVVSVLMVVILALVFVGPFVFHEINGGFTRVMVVSASVVFTMCMFYVTRFPQYINIGVVTEENAEQKYRAATTNIRLFTILALSVFAAFSVFSLLLGQGYVWLMPTCAILIPVIAIGFHVLRIKN